ncbi:MAG: acyltransferase, partial [Pseudomonadota bacterium]
MTVYNGISMFFLNLFTILVPRRIVPPIAFVSGLVTYLLATRQMRGLRSNLRVVTGRKKVELLMISCLYKYCRNWTDVMLMLRLHGSRLQALIGR